MELYNSYLLIGAPGSGKGTQGEILGTIPRFFHFACGEVFRALDTRTAIGRAFMEYSSKGLLVPDEITIELWKARFKDNVDSHLFKPDIDYLILDGIPRRIRQADLMRDIIKVHRVFHLFCPERDRLVERMQRRAVKENRFDDANVDVIRKRLQTYDDESKPLLEYYGPELVVEINAMRPPVVVLSEILNVIIADGVGLMPEQKIHSRPTA